MRVIQKGRLIKPDKYQGVCPKCHCVFECTEDDIQPVDTEGELDFVKCPTEDCDKVMGRKDLSPVYAG